MTDWRREVDWYLDGIFERLCAIRRYLHAHPEPSGEEYQTTMYVADILREAELRMRIPQGERGLIGEPEDIGEAPRIALRADIDALRLHDLKDVEYRSTNDGVTHACGHDAHTAIAVGTALTLHACRAALPWPVPWRLILQPAEESSEGAREMIEAGAVDNVAAAVALHVDPERAIGRTGFRSGTLTAYCDEIDVTVRGTGGHAARPHHASDPIAAAAQFVSAVYQFVPRSIDSRDPAVVTFGLIQGGSTQNVIPEQVRLRGTARTLTANAVETLERRIEEIARGLAAASGTTIEVAFKRGPDAVVNDERVTGVCAEAAADVVGREGIEPIAVPSMGGEDFADYLAHVPGCLFRLGVAPGGAVPPLHSPRFDLDERALLLGARIMARAVVRLAAPEAEKQ